MRTTRFLPSLPFCLLTVIVVFGVVDCRIGIAKEPRNVRLHNMLVINEDNSHFFSSRKPEDMTLKGLHAWVDQYAGSSVTHLFLCSTAMRASFRSKSMERNPRIGGHKTPSGCTRRDSIRTRSGSLAAVTERSRRG